MYITADELTTTYYPPSVNMQPGDITRFLAQANSYAQGVIGGPLPAEKLDESLKAAVAMAFEIIAKEQTDQVDPVNGNITAIADASAFVRNGRQYDPWATVKQMLEPYAAYYAMYTTQVISKNEVKFF